MGLWGINMPVYQRRQSGFGGPKGWEIFCSQRASGGVVGEKFHFKKIEGVCKVVVWCVVDGNMGLFAPTENDCPS